MRHLFTRTLLVAAFAGLAACGDDPIEPNSPSIALSVSGQSLTLAQGATGTLTATIARTSFDGAVTLTAEGAPSGMTVSFNPASLSGAVNASTVTFTAGAAVPTGVHNVTIRASGTGVTAKTATVAVTVTATGGFSLSIAPTSVTMSQGASAAANVTVARSGTFNGAVAITVTGAPTGMVVTPNPASVAAGSTTSALSITTTSATPTGTHTLTVRGNSTGLAEQTVTLTAVVTTATAGTQVSLTFCDEPTLWLAYQNEGGAWTRVTPSGNVFSFTITSAKAGVAVVSGSTTTGYSTDVLYATASEMASMATSQTAYCAGSPVGTKTLNGSVASVSATQYANISLGSSYTSVAGSSGVFTYTLQQVPDGPRDLIATRQDLLAGLAVDKVIVRRALNLATGTTIPVLDFAAAEAVAPASALLTVTGHVSGDDGAVMTSMMTANGSAGNFGFAQLSTAGTATYQGMPASKIIAGDMHQIMAVSSNTAGTSGKLAIAYYQQVVARTLALGPELTAPTLSTISATAPVRLRAVLPVQSEYAAAANAQFHQDGTGSLDRWASVQMTAAYRGAATSWDLGMPDFGSAAGYDGAAWGLRAGVAYEWDVMALNGSLFYDLAPTEGFTIKMGIRSSGSPVTPYAQGVDMDPLAARELQARWVPRSAFTPRR